MVSIQTGHPPYGGVPHSNPSVGAKRTMLQRTTDNDDGGLGDGAPDSREPAQPRSQAAVVPQTAATGQMAGAGPSSVAVAAPVFPQPIDPESGAFKPEKLLYVNAVPMQHLSALKELRAEVNKVLHHRISRRVAMGRISQRAADATLKACLGKLAKPVSMALQRFIAAKRFFAEGQACMAHEELIDGCGALGLFAKDITLISDGLANAICKAAIAAAESFAVSTAAASVGTKDTAVLQGDELHQVLGANGTASAGAIRGGTALSAPGEDSGDSEDSEDASSGIGDTGATTPAVSHSGHKRPRGDEGAADGDATSGADACDARRVLPPVAAACTRQSYCGPPKQAAPLLLGSHVHLAASTSTSSFPADARDRPAASTATAAARDDVPERASPTASPQCSAASGGGSGGDGAKRASSGVAVVHRAPVVRFPSFAFSDGMLRPGSPAQNSGGSSGVRRAASGSGGAGAAAAAAAAAASADFCFAVPAGTSAVGLERAESLQASQVLHALGAAGVVRGDAGNGDGASPAHAPVAAHALASATAGGVLRQDSAAASFCSPAAVASSAESVPKGAASTPSAAKCTAVGTAAAAACATPGAATPLATAARDAAAPAVPKPCTAPATLKEAMSGVFLIGLDGVDWHNLVQNAYGVDPEELLQQQRGEGDDEGDDVFAD